MNFLFIHILHVGKTIYITAGTEAFRIASNWSNLTCLNNLTITRVKPRGRRYQSIFMCSRCCWTLLLESSNSNRRLWHWYLSIVLSTENWRWFTSGNWHWAKFEDYRHIYPWFASWCHWCTSWFACNFRMWHNELFHRHWQKEISFYSSAKCKVPYSYGGIGRIYWVGAEYTISARRICL